MGNLVVYWVIMLVLVSCSMGTTKVAADAPGYNVVSFGAKPDGKTDASPAFLRAWASACTSVRQSKVVVPKGQFLLKEVAFRGPCRNKIKFQIYGTLVAPSTLGNSGYWILFARVNMISLIGGTFDAKGATFWACRRSGKKCPLGANSITFNWANNVEINGLTSINSQLMHVVINSCNNVMVRNVRVVAPDWSPNTDGIHVQSSTGVTLSGSSLKTGDDCISIGPGTRNLWMEKIQCGPGHGVSIGSLGRDLNEAGVQNVTLTDSVFSGSNNGLRVKTWSRPTNGFVKDIYYRNILMNKVENPIIIDQNYCPTNQGCPRQGSGIKISSVRYENIRGTSASEVAMIFDCSPTNPCTDITLRDIKISFINSNAKAKSYCKNIGGKASGVILPDNCL